jgi:hypothetical protein
VHNKNNYSGKKEYAFDPTFCAQVIGPDQHQIELFFLKFPVPPYQSISEESLSESVSNLSKV